MSVSTPITIELPASIAAQLEKEARRQKTNVQELVRELILENLSKLPSLPDDVEAELAAFHSLSDNVLWLSARTALSLEEREELADLNYQAHSRSLTCDEEGRREEVLNAYDRMVVRRAQAVMVLQARGYDLSDPSIFKFKQSSAHHDSEA